MTEISEQSWWRRVGSPEKGFRYRKVDGGRLTSRAAISRIESLAIPPAWTNVHISPLVDRKIQAWGEDSQRRRQYIYSDEHVRKQDRRKWRRVLRLGSDLPRLRSRVNQDLAAGDDLRRDVVLALAVRFMDEGFFRVGSERYAVNNHTYGLATLRKDQLEIREEMLVFTYQGKGNREVRRVVVDDEARGFMERLLELPGPRLFQYFDEAGELHPVRASDVNAYLKGAAGRRYTSKDLRTFGATARAATILADIGPAESEDEAERNVILCCRLVSQELGNTRQVCRSAYIHPAVLEEYVGSGRTIEHEAPPRDTAVSGGLSPTLAPEEAALIEFLREVG